MGAVRCRKGTGTLQVDFRSAVKRFRIQTKLRDNASNRKLLKGFLVNVEKSIGNGTFIFQDFFPSKDKWKDLLRKKLEKPLLVIVDGKLCRVSPHAVEILFSVFSEEWYSENEFLWKRSYKKTIRGNLDSYLIPAFGNHFISQISKGDILKFRAQLAIEGKWCKPLSNDRINHIMTTMRMIMVEAEERFEIPNPFARYKGLPVPYRSVDPFSFEEVQMFLMDVREDFRNYFTVRFFTAMRTGEIDGLKWQYIDFNKRKIFIRTTIVDGKDESPNTDYSVRSIDMSTPVYRAFKLQFEKTGHLNEYVFCNQKGGPLDHRNVRKRIWYPTLDRLGLKRRTPYQTRHTCATLWLAAGENPEWIARQMGHANIGMLFTLYSRYVPNLTRSDGAAFGRLLESFG